jgi:hypothetical protein
MPGERSMRPAQRVLGVLAAGVALLALGACSIPTTIVVTITALPPAPTTSASLVTTTVPATSNARLAATGDALTAPSPSRAVLITCGRTAVSAPSRYTLACADGGIWLEGLRWSAWGEPTGHASGNLWENDCTPSCADGHYLQYPASVTVSRLAGGRYTWLHVSAPQAPGGPYDDTVGPAGPGRATKVRTSGRTDQGCNRISHGADVLRNGAPVVEL